jgi:hypothetical protein
MYIHKFLNLATWLNYLTTDVLTVVNILREKKPGGLGTSSVGVARIVKSMQFE